MDEPPWGAALTPKLDRGLTLPKPPGSPNWELCKKLKDCTFSDNAGYWQLKVDECKANPGGDK